MGKSAARTVTSRFLPFLTILLLFMFFVAGTSDRARAEGGASEGESYTNPLQLEIPGSDTPAESCADPTVIRGQTPGDDYWYLYCTTDPLHGEDRDANGEFNFRLIPTFRSRDLVNWTYTGDVFEERPAWVRSDAGLWASEIQYFNGAYYLYFSVQHTVQGGSAIGVATAPTPLGPWQDQGMAVEPHDADCCPGSKRWTIDPDIIEVDGQRYIFYGSYFGGVSARKLSADGLRSDSDSQVQIAIPNRYEGINLIERDGYYYILLSATDCCRGPLTGYTVFAGRSRHVLGPYVDGEGVSLLDGRVGGTPVLSMNGNRWVGPGHHDFLTDFDGQDWIIYHAIDREDPYFAGATGFTKRPVLLDPLDWKDGWPTARGGWWVSDEPMPRPAAQPGERTAYEPTFRPADRPGPVLFEEQFDGEALGEPWQWIREPSSGSYGLENDTFRLDTHGGDLWVDRNDAPVLTMPAPDGDYVVETKVALDLPPEGCCFNYTQAGLVIYGDDDNFLKLVHFSNWETRQTEFAKEAHPVPSGFPRYGNTVVGPPGDWTYLRIVRRSVPGSAGDRYSAYTSQDGERWVRGGTWSHTLGDDSRIGLVAMSGEGFTAQFDYVRVQRLMPLEADLFGRHRRGLFANYH